MHSANRKSFFVAVICLVLCVALLVGTTFAWFTDSVSNTGNRIQAGTLDIDLLMDKTMQTSAASDYVSIGGTTGDIFKEAAVAQNSYETLWEPGKTQAVFLAVENKGNLAVKYNTYIDVTDNGLVGSLEYALFDEGTYVKYKELIEGECDTWEKLKAKATVSGDIEAGRNTIKTGVLDEIAHDPSVSGERDYVALVVHMKEDAGNDYQNQNIIIDVTLSATQYTAEEDGFGNAQYDADAAITDPAAPVHVSSEIYNTVKTETDDNLTFKATGDVLGASLAKTTAENLFTAEEKTDGSKDMLLNLNVDTTENTSTSVTYDLTLYKTITTTTGGVTTKGTPSKVEDTLDTYLEAVLQLPAGLKDVSVTHSGNAMEKLSSASGTPTDENGAYYYDYLTGELTIWSKSFSPFKVTFTVETDAELIVSKDGLIVGYLSFADFRKSVKEGSNYYGYTVTQQKDIDLADVDMELFRADNSVFAGVYDGNYHTISHFNNICTYEDSKYASLFYYMYDVTIKNLTLKDCTFDNSYWSSSFIGYQSYGNTLVLDNVHIENCDIENGWENQFFIFAPSSDVTTVKNCSTDAASSMDCIYGNYGCWFRQACYTDFNMTDCTNNAPMRGRGFVGAFVGQLGTNVYNATFTNCVNNGEIRVYESSSANSRFLYCGGFIGYKNSSAEDTSKEQKITFTGCKNNGNIIVEDVSGSTGNNGGAVGGYIGYVNGTTIEFNNCENNADVGSSLVQRASGFVGWENGDAKVTYNNCTQKGNITASSTNGIAGAFVAGNNGVSQKSAVNPVSEGTVSGKTIVKISGES